MCASVACLFLGSCLYTNRLHMWRTCQFKRHCHCLLRRLVDVDTWQVHTYTYLCVPGSWNSDAPCRLPRFAFCCTCARIKGAWCGTIHAEWTEREEEKVALTVFKTCTDGFSLSGYVLSTIRKLYKSELQGY